MVDRNRKIRFADNNMLADSAVIKTASSANVTYPFANCYDDTRYKVWVTAGNFEIDATNNKVYINDGSDKTATITSGTYTGSSLATEIQTQLNSVSSAWTVSYSSTSYLFTIAHSGSATVRLSQTTEAAWDTLGYVGILDVIGTSWVSDEQRIHTAEHVTIDLGTPIEMNFFAALGPLDEIFTISNSATVTLKADNIPNNFASAAFSRTLDVTDRGIMEFLDDTEDTTYRYWQFKIIDRMNPLGPGAVKLGQLYLGDYRTITVSNVNNGFGKTWDDRSQIVYSEYGIPYFNKRPKVQRITSLSIPYMDGAERRILEQMVYDIGLESTFYISLDPTTCASLELDEMTKFVRFKEMPDFVHEFKDRYTMNFEVEEVL